MKTDVLVKKIVNRYIGVDGGYLGVPDRIRFTIRNHEDFYSEYCDLSKNPNEYEGTTRQRFIAVFKNSSPKEQAKIIKGIVQRFPVSEKFETRTEELKQELLAEAGKLEKINLVKSPDILATSVVVFEALEDAESLIKERKPVSAVDRVHTAFHGYLRFICTEEKIEFDKKDDVVVLVKKVVEKHSKFRVPDKEHEIKNIVKNMASISDSLNPIRNSGSLAHPNENLLEDAEANLVINCVRTLLIYFSSKFN